MDRPRHPRYRRRDPQRTGPIRNAGEALWDAEPRRGSTRHGEDAASRGVREGYRLIDEQIRRGRRAAQEIESEPWNDDRHSPGRRRRARYDEEDWRQERRGGYHFLETPMRHVELLTREILRQIGSARPDPLRLTELILRLQIEAASELIRLGFSVFGGLSPRWRDSFEEEVERMDRDIDEIQEEIWEEEWESDPWPWPAAPSTPTTIRSTVPIPIYVSSHERTEIGLELSPGSQSLDLEIEPPVVAGATDPTPATPPFEAEFVALADAPAILRIEVPRHLPAGRYLRRILIRATGEPVGDLTVQVGSVKVSPPPKAKKR